MFEDAGVARTERSVIYWCQRNHQGVARLDAFFDMNERKYFVTPQSVTAAIREEQAKAAANGIPATLPLERAIPKSAEDAASHSEDADTIKTLELKMRNLDNQSGARNYWSSVPRQMSAQTSFPVIRNKGAATG